MKMHPFYGIIWDVEMTDFTRIESDNKPTAHRLNEYHGHGCAFLMWDRETPSVWFVGNRKGGLCLLRQRRRSDKWYFMDERYDAVDDSGRPMSGHSALGDYSISNPHNFGSMLLLDLTYNGETITQAFNLASMASKGPLE